MFKFTSALVLILLMNSACSQNSKIRLIVRGDDMGFSHSGNLALIKCYKEGIESAIEVIVPSPWFPEAVKMLNDNPKVDVGIHLVLTSEWDNVKWRPLTNAKTLTDSNGYFFPMIWPNKNYPDLAVLQNKWNIDEVEKEWRAQIELAKKNIPRLSHISAHMGCTDMNEQTKALAKKLAKEYNIDIDPSEYGVKYAPFDGPAKTAAEKKAAFVKMLNTLEAGNTYLFVEHPGIDDAELRAIHHIGYENVASDRQGVTDTWTDAQIKEIVRKRGIQLIGYSDLKK